MTKNRIIKVKTTKGKPIELALLAPSIANKVSSDKELSGFFLKNAQINLANAQELVNVERKIKGIADSIKDAELKNKLQEISKVLFKISEKDFDLNDVHTYCATKGDEK